MKQLVILGLLSAFLAGCGLHSVREARYKEECQDDFGLQPGSGAFMNCVMAKHHSFENRQRNSAIFSGATTYRNTYNW